MYNTKGFRPITVPQFITDAINICESEEIGDSELKEAAHEKISQYFKLFPEGSWIIRSIKLLLDENSKPFSQAK